MSGIMSAAGSKSLVVFAGAGILAGAPTSLSRLKPANAAIFRALRDRFESVLNAKDWLLRPEQALESKRQEELFPPDYQAQVIEEVCGDRYFRALQSLDVNVANAAHEGIAALAAAGALRAIVTTNF